ncbi:GDSL esterase/lipase At4g10955-like [Quercus lobata]|uniref:GDSL esterase/lipase At4g10955-like n=1 Tax=Quercus lobata TaxID=97700 RepID=UPI00124533E0|nr:GDSL esterase/lipase At4g10955-like [Quercus lobata]
MDLKVLLYLAINYVRNMVTSSRARWIKNNIVSFGNHLTKSKSVDKASLSRSGKGHRQHVAQAHEIFVALSNWVPYLFVNPDDPVSSEYIHYFENRQKMLELGFENVVTIASMMTMRMALGIDSSSEAIHLIPSAILTINKVEFHQDIHGLCGFIKEKEFAHQLQQWWSPDSSSQSWEYRYVQHYKLNEAEIYRCVLSK